MIPGRYIRHDFMRPEFQAATHSRLSQKRKERDMKIIKAQKSDVKMKFTHVQVAVRLVGEGVEGKQAGKTVYSMFDYVDVGDAKPDEVFGVVVRAIEAASQKR